MPATRLLANRLGVSRSTVIAAYEELTGEGLLQVRHGSGTYVSDLLAAPGPARALDSDLRQPRPGEREDDPELLDMTPGRPDISRLLTSDWNRAWQYAGSLPDSAEPDRQGLPELREQISADLRAARGIDVDAARILITAGTNDALLLIAHALELRGRVVAVEDPGYPSARSVLRREGCRLVGIPVDEDGLDVTSLEATGRVRAALTTPSNQYPMGRRLPVRRREALLRWAEEADATIVEDDYDSEFRFGVPPLPALVSLDRGERVIHVGTFSKSVTPWLRAGYVVVPDRLVPSFMAVRQDLGAHVGGPVQLALAHFMRTGALRRHVAAARRDYQHKRAHLIRRLEPYGDKLRVTGTSAGLHAVIELPDGPAANVVVEAVRSVGVSIADLDDYRLSRSTAHTPAVVLGYAGTPLSSLDRVAAALIEATSGAAR